ncbi:MAG: hypothetical protein GF307_05985 [candidate division Zixibacteria bacterium]|nr:hypothetical protein [candidate division Zixibacteria bacterium]
MYEYVASQQTAGDVTTYIVNRAGVYQLVKPELGQPLDKCPITISSEELSGFREYRSEQGTLHYAFWRLRSADWALIVQSTPASGALLDRPQSRSLLVSGALILIAAVVIVNRAGKLVAQQKETDQTRA